MVLLHQFLEFLLELLQLVAELVNLARIARELSDAGVNVLGHLFLGRWSDRATFAFIVDDPDKARPILERR